MRNLLPLANKKNIRNEYRFRLIIVALFLIFIVFALGVFSLLPSFFLSESRNIFAHDRALLVEQSIASREQDTLTQAFIEANDKLELLSEERDRFRVNELIRIVLNHKPAGVLVQGFSFDTGALGENVLTIQGHADRRDNLLLFKSKLAGDTLFSDVTLPVSSLAQERNVEFSMSLKGAF